MNNRKTAFLNYSFLILTALSIASPAIYAISGSLDGVGPLRGIEWQVDMPWRMEPTNHQKAEYDPIPITFTIHDVAQQSGLKAERLLLNKFCGMYVIEFQPGKEEPETEVTFFSPDDFFEIESSKGVGVAKNAPIKDHQIRKMWNNDAPDDLLNMGEWSEWHATVYYTPVGGIPKGGDLRIIAAARVSMTSDCSDQYYSASDIVNQLRRNNQFLPIFGVIESISKELEILKDDEETKDENYSRSDLIKEHMKKLNNVGARKHHAYKVLDCIRYSNTYSYCSGYKNNEQAYKLFQSANKPLKVEKLISNDIKTLNQKDSLFFGDFLRTHYSADPLPKFSKEWAYGDLHYHSQGTDNEGESGTSYRSALASMKALGLDYTFATDHASDSSQLTGLDRYKVNINLDGNFWISNFIGDWVINKMNDLINNATGGGIPATRKDAARDMTPRRFDHLLGWLQGFEGANTEITERPGSSRTPQLFLGGEVDVIPDISVEEAEQGSYGSEFLNAFKWEHSCISLPRALVNHLEFSKKCKRDLQIQDSKNGMVSLKDVQGVLETKYFARQHLLYLPYNVDPSAENKDRFISSSTTEYGGASKHLYDVLEQEVEAKELGFIFLAHPVSTPSGNGFGRLGPDIYPYSKGQLEVAFASPRVLGLQLWNENALFHSTADNDNAHYPFLHGVQLQADNNGQIDWGDLDWRWNKIDSSSRDRQLTKGEAMWDVVNLWGITPEKTEAIGLLKGKPRKFFMAGGSDAHGDMNYRREGAITGWNGTNDTALGTPRNMTFIGPELKGGGNGDTVISQNQVIDGLQSGRFSVTDGPAFRIAIDTNNNGKIDDQDIHMGEDASMAVAQGQDPHDYRFSTALALSSKVRLLVEWKSTPEWGPVKEIQLVVGVQAGTHEGAVYQHRISLKACRKHDFVKDLAGGIKYCPEPTYNWSIEDPNGKLTFNVPASKGMYGRDVIELDTYDYRLFDTECTLRSIYSASQGRSETMTARAKPRPTIITPTPSLINTIEDPIKYPIIDPIIPETVDELPDCIATNIVNPRRMFIRAKASTVDSTTPPFIKDYSKTASSQRVNRLAYSNPIWIRDIPETIFPTLTVRETVGANIR